MRKALLLKDARGLPALQCHPSSRPHPSVMRRACGPAPWAVLQAWRVCSAENQGGGSLFTCARPVVLHFQSLSEARPQRSA